MLTKKNGCFPLIHVPDVGASQFDEEKSISKEKKIIKKNYKQLPFSSYPIFILIVHFSLNTNQSNKLSCFAII